MPGNYFWGCVEALAITFDGSAAEVEENLDVYAQHCLELPPEKRAEVKRQMTMIIGGLAQLQARINP